jgi:hypothetical protein
MAGVDRWGERAAKAVRRLIEEPELPITGVSMVHPDRGQVPVLRLDMSRRPDVRDLARVHQIEGSGQVVVLARGVRLPDRGGWVLLDIRVTRPVRCRFRLALSLASQREILEALAGSGLLGVLPDDVPGRRYSRALYLVIEPAATLRAMAAAV